MFSPPFDDLLDIPFDCFVVVLIAVVVGFKVGLVLGKTRGRPMVDVNDSPLLKFVLLVLLTN